MVKTIHRSARGRAIDFDSIQASHDKVIAVGNAGYNARGDLLGTGGRIVKTVEQIDKETKISSIENAERNSNISIKDNLDDLQKARLSWVENGGMDLDPADALNVAEAADMLMGKAPTKKDKKVAEPKAEKSSSSKRKIVDED